MSKFTNLNNLDKLSKALNNRCKELIDEEKARAIAEEQILQAEIDITKDMFGGKSIKYVTQAEYDILTEDEKNSDTVTYFITDAVDLSHEHENKEFLDNLAARNISIGNKSQLFDGVNDLVYSLEDIGVAPIEHNHDDRYYTETEVDEKIEDINESINEHVAVVAEDLFNLQANVVALDNYKAEKVYVDEQIANITNNNITESELDSLLEEIFGINDKNELTSVRLGNYQMKYDSTNDTLDFLYNGAIDEPIVETIPLAWKVGNLSGTDGSETEQSSTLRTGFVTIEDNCDYSFYLDTSMGDPRGIRVYLYDVDKAYISRTDGDELLYTTGIDISIDIPANAAYMRFKSNVDSTTTINNINSLFTLRKRKIEVNNYVTEGLSMYIDASDVTTYGSIRDITGNYTITNHGVTHTSDNNYLNFVASESDYLDTNLVPNLSTWSAEIYFYYTAEPTSSEVTYSWGSSSSNRIRLAYSDTDNAMKIITPSGQNTFGSIDEFLTLRHMVVTGNSGVYTVYIDGTKQVTINGTTVLSSHTGTLKIGTDLGASGKFANMNLKSFRFYDGKVLSDAEVLQNYKYETKNSYVTEGLSMYIDASDVTTYGSIRDITGKQSITNHGVSTTLDNGCLNFVASESDYIETELIPNLTTWSAELYFYFTDTPTNTGIVLGWGDPSGNKVRIGYTPSGVSGFIAQINDNTNRLISAIDNMLSLHHLIVTMDNGTFLAYLDGTKIELATGEPSLVSHTSPVKLGCKYNGASQFANMHLKLFRFYDGKALTDEEALQNYNYEINRG